MSIYEQLRAFPKAWALLTLVCAVVASAASWGLSAGVTYANLATKDDLAKARAKTTALGKLLGAPPRPTLNHPTPVPIFDRLQALEDAKTAQIERVGLEIRERVGLQVALHRALKVAPGSKAQRDAAEVASVAAKAKFDQFVQRMSPIDAANKVLEEARVPR